MDRWILYRSMHSDAVMLAFGCSGLPRQCREEKCGGSEVDYEVGMCV